MAPTRVHFSEELDRLETDAMGGLDLVAELIPPTIGALERSDAEAAGRVIAGDDIVDACFLVCTRA